MDKHVSNRTKLLTTLWLVLALGAVFSLARLGFLAGFEGLHGLKSHDTWRALYLGFKFDLRLAAILAMPAWLLLGNSEAPSGLAPWRSRLAPWLLALTLI